MDRSESGQQLVGRRREVGARLLEQREADLEARRQRFVESAARLAQLGRRRAVAGGWALDQRLLLEEQQVHLGDLLLKGFNPLEPLLALHDVGGDILERHLLERVEFQIEEAMAP